MPFAKDRADSIVLCLPAIAAKRHLPSVPYRRPLDFQTRADNCELGLGVGVAVAARISVDSRNRARP
jgi:hypothetical protein